MPNIVSLTLPAIPDKDFFSYDFPNLSTLKLECDGHHESFIKNLADSKLLLQISLDFKDIRSLAYGEITPFSDYLQLFSSKYIGNGLQFKLREYQLSKVELLELQKCNEKIQFLHIPLEEDNYINHLIFRGTCLNFG